MAQNGKWVTINGTHIYLKEGQTIEQAFQDKKKLASLEEKYNTEPRIEENTNITKTVDNRKRAAYNAGTALDKAVNEVEKANYKLDYEVMTAIDSNGNIVLELSGDKSKVKFGYNVLEKMKGLTVTHNHPDKSTTFSKADIDILVNGDLEELRTTATDGTVMSLTKVDDAATKYSFAENFEKYSMELIYIKANELKNLINQGKISEAEAGKEVHNHGVTTATEWLEYYATEYGYKFNSGRIWQ